MRQNVPQFLCPYCPYIIGQKWVRLCSLFASLWTCDLISGARKRGIIAIHVSFHMFHVLKSIELFPKRCEYKTENSNRNQIWSDRPSIKGTILPTQWNKSIHHQYVPHPIFRIIFCRTTFRYRFRVLSPLNCTHIYTYMYIQMCVWEHLYISILVQVCIYIHVHMHVHSTDSIYIYVHMHVHIQVCWWQHASRITLILFVKDTEGRDKRFCCLLRL